MSASLSYAVGIFRHFADAKQFAAALTEAKIASRVESISGETHIVFVKRSQGTRAEHMRGAWAERQREAQR
jgi:hypothetical protein